MKNKFIVIVDDDPAVVKLLCDYFSKEGCRAKGFPGDEGLFEFLKRKTPDLIILDLKMPGASGFDICGRLKNNERFASIPVIILSGKDEEADKVSGLDMGADDYIVKPFSLNELNARIGAVLRRQDPVSGAKTIEAGGMLVIDQDRHQVTVDGGKVELTPAEFKILELLASRKGRVFSRDGILEYLWGEEKIVIERTVDVHIRHLREKLGRAGDLIKNVRGVGYKIEEDG